MLYPPPVALDPLPLPPVQPEEAAAWAKVDECDHQESIILAQTLKAAMAWAESVDGAGQPLFDRRFKTVLDGFWSGEFDAFFVTAVEKVEYQLPGENALTLLPASAYRFEDGCLRFLAEAHALGPAQRVEITHRCGIPAGQMREDIKLELLRYVGYNYQNRGDEKPSTLVWRVRDVVKPVI